MQRFRQGSWLALICGAAVLAAGCGEAPAGYSPTAPTTAFTPAAPTTGGPPDLSTAASIDDESSVRKNGGDKTNGSNRGPREDAVHVDGDGPHGRRGMLSGFITAVGSDSITIRGIVVKITETTVVRHGHHQVPLADIVVGDHAQARGAMEEGMLVASEVKVERTRRNRGDEAEAEDEDDND